MVIFTQLNLLVNEMKECDSLLNKIKIDKFFNPTLFLINSFQKVITIQNIVEKILNHPSIRYLTQKMRNQKTDIKKKKDI